MPVNGVTTNHDGELDRFQFFKYLITLGICAFGAGR